jgi:hypothetical protein
LKIKHFILGIAFTVFYTTGFSQPKPSTKHALIVAIGDYPKEGGWGSISGNKDVPFLQTALRNQGFNDSQIYTLIDSQASRSAIETTLRALYSSIKPGDVLLIHFSTHGEQIEDDNHDEPDGLDEAIVTYHSVAPAKASNFANDTAEYLRDDIFGQHVQKLREILGPEGDLIVVIDACHSGSGSRGQNKTRGGVQPLVSPNFKKPDSKTTNPEVFRDAKVDANNLASYVVFSAARAEELAFEVLTEDNQSMGSLSYAFCKAIEQLESGITYRGFFSKIQSIINAKIQGQHPVLEGDGIDRQLFGGKFELQLPYVEIEKFLSPTLFEISGGRFLGLNPGAKVVLMPAGTLNPQQAVAADTGIVVNSSSYKATIQTLKTYKSQPTNTWVFPLEPVYTIDSVVLLFQAYKKEFKNMGFQQKEIQEIQQVLTQIPQIVYRGSGELLLKKGKEKDSIFLVHNGLYFAGIPHDAQYYESLKMLLTQYVQYKYLRAISIPDSTIKVKVTLVPIRNSMPDTAVIMEHYRAGVLTFTTEDYFTLKVSNSSKFPIYINILDLQPDGRMSAILPNREAGVYDRDLKIEAGETRIFTDYEIGLGEPYGTEIYKIFISKKILNLEDIIALKNPEAFRGNLGVLENIAHTSKQLHRGSNLSVKTSNANGSVFDLVFEIAPE